jgi:hypothetical protein
VEPNSLKIAEASIKNLWGLFILKSYCDYPSIGIWKLHLMFMIIMGECIFNFRERPVYSLNSYAVYDCMET